jgi:hypothetical protein
MPATTAQAPTTSIFDSQFERLGALAEPIIAMTANKIAHANRPITAAQFSLSQIFRMALQRDLQLLSFS